MACIRAIAWSVLVVTLGWVQFATGQDAKVALSDVPAAAKEAADGAEPGTKWSQAYREKSGKHFVLVGRKVVRAAKEQVTADGDVDVIPADTRTVDVTVKPDGTIVEIVIDVPVDELPAPVLAAVKKTNDLEPQIARAVRTSAKGKPTGYFVALDANGLIQYEVSADGKKVAKVE